MEELSFDNGGNNENLIKKADLIRGSIQTMNMEPEGVNGSGGIMSKTMGTAFNALGGTEALKEFATEIVHVRSEFQLLEVSFAKLLQSKEKSDVLMSQLIKTAIESPFNITELAAGAKQLIAYGVETEQLNNTLLRLGNIASGVGLPLGDLISLYGAVMTQGNLYSQELDKFTSAGIPMLQKLADMYGVNTDEISEMASVGKIGFAEVQNVIESLINQGGMFYGAMSEESKTIAGQISNIEDAFSSMFNDIGKQSEGFINDALSGVASLLENYEEIGQTIFELIAAYGAYKAILMSISAYQSAATGIAYTTEIVELGKLLPLKQLSANEDVMAAVASGRLTQSKAELVIALRAEANAKLMSLSATKTQAEAEFSNSLASYKASRLRYTAAQEQMAIAQSQMAIAVKSGTATEIEIARQNAQIASTELNNAAIAKNNAHKAVSTAATNSKSASEAFNTMQTGLNTAAQTTNTTSTNILTIAKNRLAAASKALGLSQLANPYVLAAAAVVGLGYGIYKLITYQTDAEKAQEKLNDAVKEAEKSSLSEQRELAKLKGELSALTKGTDEYNSVKDKIVKGFGKYDANLEAEIDKVGLTETAYNKLSEAISKSFAARQYEKFAAEQQDELSNVMAENLEKIQTRLLEKLGDESGAHIFAKIRDAVLKGNLSIGNSYLDIKGLDKGTLTVLDQISGVASNDVIINKAIEGGLATIIRATQNADKQDKKARERLGIESSKSKKGSGSSPKKEDEKKVGSEWVALYKKNYEDAEKAYNDFLNSKEKMEEAEREKELKRLKEVRDNAKAIYDASRGDVNNTRPENKADQRREYQEKLEEEIIKNTWALEAERNAILEDGKAKRLALSKQEWKEKKYQLTKEYNQRLETDRANGVFTHDPRIKANYDARMLENDNAKVKRDEAIELEYTKELADHEKELTLVLLSEEGVRQQAIKDRFEKEREWAKKQKDNGNMDPEEYENYSKRIDVAETQATLKGLLDKYQDFEQQRVLLEKEYQDEEAVLQKGFLDAKTDAERQQCQKSLDELAKKRKKGMEDINDAELSELTENSDLFVRLFSRTSDMSTSMIKKVLADAKTLIDYLNGISNKKPAGFTDKELEKLQKDPEKINEIYDAISEKQNQLDSTTNYPFSGFIKGLTSLKESSKLANKALNETDVKVKRSLEFQAEASKEKGMNYIAAGAVEAADCVSFLAEKMYELAEATGNEALSESAEQLGAVAQNFSAAAQGFQSGGWIGAIVGGATDMISQTIAAVTTSKAEDAEKEQNALDFLREYNMLLLEVKDEDYDNAFGSRGLEKAMVAAGKAKEALRKYDEELSKRTAPSVKKEFNSLGAAIFGMGLDGGLGFNLFGFGKKVSNETKTLQAAYKKGYTDLQAMAVKTKDRSGWANFWGKKDKYTSLKDLAPQLWDASGTFNIDAAKAFLDTNTQISDEQRKQIQNVIDLKGAYEENMQIIRDEIKDTFGSLGDAATNSIVEAIKTGADAFQLFEDAGSEVIGNLGKKLMYELFFAKKFEELQKKLEKSYDEGTSPEDIARRQTEILGEFFGEIGSTMEEAEAWGQSWKEYAAENGFEDTWSGSSSQGSSQKGFAAMSQDTGEELNGRFTALQISNEEIKNSMLFVLGSLSSLCTTVSDGNILLTEMRNLALMSNGHLEDIARHTKVLLGFGEKLDSINRNTLKI